MDVLESAVDMVRKVLRRARPDSTVRQSGSGREKGKGMQCREEEKWRLGLQLLLLLLLLLARSRREQTLLLPLYTSLVYECKVRCRRRQQ